MSALAQIRGQGFTLEPALDDGLYIEPIDELTDVQRLWLVSNKSEIRRQLITERWHWFLSLANDHGIHPHVVGAEFPTDADRMDVIESAEHDDILLRDCMATLCTDERVKRRQQDYEAGRWIPVNPDGTLRN